MNAERATDEPKKGRKSYLDVAEEANKPLALRERSAIGRQGKSVVPRRYHLNDEKLALIQENMSKSGKFISPFRKGGSAYNAIIESLIELGENEVHPLYTAFEKFKEILGRVKSKKNEGKTAWDDFDNKMTRNQATGLDSLGRFLQNCYVLQRLGGANQYGFKLAQLGACVDVLKSGENIQVRLRTGLDGMVIPMCETKTRARVSGVHGVMPGSIGLSKFVNKEPEPEEDEE